MEAIEIYADSSRGQYIPQYFAESYAEGWNVSAEDIATLLRGPDEEFYWDAWVSVLDSATFDTEEGQYILHQDGDLFAICIEKLTDEERNEFF